MQLGPYPPAKNAGLQPLVTDGCWNTTGRVAGRWHIVMETSLRTLAEYFGVLEAIGPGKEDRDREWL
ncbi:hypothetical protein AC20117_22465 (plasmid) [Arthrobacter crystallopoietes]|nr:hypothetical protein AC20117_22455 [Arthrobacter crystallopoietes]AUI53718.1 hypothetical protein AC20117_22460 [Arthrobacter crystallopoietes]AUI53719.1 hypothetical protein AC20117_22465 [Arthrobacter crystallopoietes]